MNNYIGRIISIIFLAFIATPIEAEVLTFNRSQAMQYAENFCNKINESLFKDFSSPGGNCANFGSQNIIAGFGGLDVAKNEIKGNPFGCVKDATIIGIDGKTKGIVSASEFPSPIGKSFCFEKVSTVSRSSDGDTSADKAINDLISKRKLGSGDIVVLRDGATGDHIGVLSADGKVYANSGSQCGSYSVRGFLTWKDKNGKKVHSNRFYNADIYHFPDDDKCNECRRNEKTCTVKMEPKCDGCSTCSPLFGICDSKCGQQPTGRCAPGSRCECIILSDIIPYKICDCFKTAPSGDCPDDTFTVASQPQTGETITTNSLASIGILDLGYTYDMQKLLASFGEDVRTLLPSDISPSLAQSMPLLIIPTGGLNGMENSSFFRTTLDEYVKQGGNILVLSQQRGYEYSVLPVPVDPVTGKSKPISGYGWAEDQSCFSNSTYIDTWHNVLAGQTQTTPSLNVDGYFTKYPNNATIFLRRIANGQPALIMYDYGFGKVIVTSMYSDWAYGYGQASSEEIALVRDMISWA